MANSVNLIASRTTRRFLLGLGFSFVAFVLWLVPSYVVMSPDKSYAERVLREAELVAAAIARGGMASRPSSKIGDPRDPRIIAAKRRSPFHKNHAEGIMRQMHSIINKRIVLYDHRRRVVLDSYNFNRANRFQVEAIPAPTQEKEQQTKPFPPPNYLPPPRGDNKFVLAALGGQAITRKITPNQKRQTSFNVKSNKKFTPKQPILLAVAPVRRLKLVQGAVLLIDDKPQERAQWRWRSLLQDNASVFAAIIVVLLLLWLWLKDSFVNPLARLAYSAEGAESKYNDELGMLSHRQELGQLAARNFSYTTKLFKRHEQKINSKTEKQILSDSEMAALIHDALMSAKLETANLALIIQQVVNRQNIRERNHILRKAHKTNDIEFPYKNKVQLAKLESNGHRNPWHLPLFLESLKLCIDYLVQAAALAQTDMWEGAVRVSLVRKAKTIELIIEDDGEDIPAPTLSDWLRRCLPEHSVRWTKASLEKTIEMHAGKLSFPSLRPPCLKLTFPLSPKNSGN
jgi:hypothetical protein